MSYPKENIGDGIIAEYDGTNITLYDKDIHLFLDVRTVCNLLKFIREMNVCDGCISNCEKVAATT